MFRTRFLLIVILSLFASLVSAAQDSAAFGALEVSGRVSIGGKQQKLSRKRFYLLPGGLKDNKPLIERLNTASIKSRDCFYSENKASPEFICWLKAENCESPYCRDISTADIARVPEFQAAYKKSVPRFRGKTAVAEDWLTTSLPPSLVNGFYLQRRLLTSELLGAIKPINSTMTDSTTVKALFFDIPVEAGAKKAFVVSNILPIEFENKSYLWACEVEIGTGKTTTLRLSLPANDKPVKNCEVWVKDLPACGAGSCETK